MELQRKDFLVRASLGVLAFTVAGRQVWLTSRQAREQGVPLSTFSPQQAHTLDAIGETLLPGAREAGITNYVDQQIGVDPAESLLILRYLDYPPPYAPFYAAVLAALDAASRAAHGHIFAGSAAAERQALVQAMATGNPRGWQGPPALLAYFALRGDAVDVVYGTVEGFSKLKLPYMPHILPPRRW
jgi:hypothetical protein